MTLESKEDWGRGLPSDDYLILVGALSAHYNRLEHNLRHIFMITTGLERKVSGILFDAVNNQTRLETIIVATKENQKIPNCGVSEVEYLKKLFGLCAENRNIIMHAFVYPISGGRATFHKYPKGQYIDVNTYSPTISDLEECVSGVQDSSRYAFCLGAAIGRHINSQSPNWSDEYEPLDETTLPERPPLPKKLSPRRYIPASVPVPSRPIGGQSNDH